MRTDAIEQALAPVLAPLGVDLYDVEFAGTGKARTLRVLVDQPGGIDLEAVRTASRAISDAIDTLDPVGGTFTLEVSSPGVERPLRRVEHFAAAMGKDVSVKFRDEAGATQRVRGAVLEATDTTCRIDAEQGAIEIPYDQIVAAHTVFEFGGQPKSQRPKARAAGK
jgi:ribosome maturation factor RimP